MRMHVQALFMAWLWSCAESGCSGSTLDSPAPRLRPPLQCWEVHPWQQGISGLSRAATLRPLRLSAQPHTLASAIFKLEVCQCSDLPTPYKKPNFGHGSITNSSLEAWAMRGRSFSKFGIRQKVCTTANIAAGPASASMRKFTATSIALKEKLYGKIIKKCIFLIIFP